VLNSKMQKEIHNTTVIACSVPSIYEYLWVQYSFRE
jgi:hypothetical protein